MSSAELPIRGIKSVEPYRVTPITVPFFPEWTKKFYYGRKQVDPDEMWDLYNKVIIPQLRNPVKGFIPGLKRSAWKEDPYGNRSLEFNNLTVFDQAPSSEGGGYGKLPFKITIPGDSKLSEQDIETFTAISLGFYGDAIDFKAIGGTHYGVFNFYGKQMAALYMDIIKTNGNDRLRFTRLLREGGIDTNGNEIKGYPENIAAPFFASTITYFGENVIGRTEAGRETWNTLSQLTGLHRQLWKGRVWKDPGIKVDNKNTDNVIWTNDENGKEKWVNIDPVTNIL